MPTSRMCPPTQSIAAVPTTEMTVSSFGMARTMPRPSAATPAEPPLRQAQADVVHLHDEPDDAVDQDRDADRDDRQDERPARRRPGRSPRSAR